MWSGETFRNQYPFKPDTQIVEPESEVVEFLSEPGFEDVYIKPKPIKSYVADNRENYQFNISMPRSMKARIEALEGIRNYMETGWVIPCVEPLSITVSTDPMRAVTSRLNSEFIEESRLIDDPDIPYNCFIKLNTRWAAKTKDGYSLLVTYPEFLDNDHRGLSAVIDTDSAPQYLKMPLLLQVDGREKIRVGDPLAHVIPIKRSMSSATE